MADKQTKIPYSREARFAALRGIDPNAVFDQPVGPRSWANVVDLLTQIELCTLRDGCFAYTQTLAARMRGGLGVSRATFFRTRALAEDLGLLEALQRETDWGRQQSNEWKVDWNRVSILSANTPATGLRLGGRKLRPLGVKLRRGGLKMRPFNKGTVPTSISSSVSSQALARSTKRTDQKNLRWEEIRMQAEHLKKYFLDPITDGDWSLLVKAVALWHVGLLSEQAVTSAARGAYLTGKNRWAVFTTCLKEACEQRGLVLRQCLARLEPPEGVLREAVASDLGERLNR